jgi:hypothetical protein
MHLQAPQPRFRWHDAQAAGDLPEDAGSEADSPTFPAPAGDFASGCSRAEGSSKQGSACGGLLDRLKGAEAWIIH